MKFMFGLSILSHANLQQPFRTLEIKWEVNIFLKKSFLRLYHAFSFLRLYRCVAVDDYITFIAIWCLFQQSSSRIQNEPGYRKRQFLSITTRHQRKGQRKMLELKEVKKQKQKNKNKNKWATNRWTDWREKKERKERKKIGRQRAGRKEEEEKKTRNKNKPATEKRKKRKKKKEM